MLWKHARLIAIIAVAGCEQPGATASAVERALGAYAPGIQIGQTIEQARQVLPGLVFPHGGPFTRGTIPQPRWEFTEVRLIDSRGDWETPPDFTTARVVRVELVAQGPVAEDAVVKDLTALWGGPPRLGCASNASGTWQNRVYLWVAPDSGGVAFELPETRAADDATTIREPQITVFGGSWKPQNVTSMIYREGACRSKENRDLNRDVT